MVPLMGSFMTAALPNIDLYSQPVRCHACNVPLKVVFELLQVLPAGASKGKGVEQLLQHLNIKPERVLAMGDGENDKVMLQVNWLHMYLTSCSMLAAPTNVCVKPVFIFCMHVHLCSCWKHLRYT